MVEAAADVNYRVWDRLPDAAKEAQDYLERLLTEAAIKAHGVSARAKSISSFEDKCLRKQYEAPRQDVTDTVAVRIITYSVTDRERAEELIRDRFEVTEDHNPGDVKERRRRGYDCHHFVVGGESPEALSGWLIAGGKLSQYFEEFGGLEIQIRTVAAHAWAEFEHARRYKGEPYQVIDERDRITIDQLFGAAADARRALDETFVAIDRILANPSPAAADEWASDDAHDEQTPESGRSESDTQTLLDADTLASFLSVRFPDDEMPTEHGVEFGVQLVGACALTSIEELQRELNAIDGDRVRLLMDTTIPVTRVRRLDDELLARFGASYIDWTAEIGIARNRRQQLEWRFDRVRNKVPAGGYKTYELAGADCPTELQGVGLPAARAVREVARLVAQRLGPPAARVENAVAETTQELPASARAKQLSVGGGQHLWVATNLGRRAAEQLLDELLHNATGLDLSVLNKGREIASTTGK